MARSAKGETTTATGGTSSDGGRATRETIESFVMAVILAFLFRTFVAEAFVIPTGSMAPTLQGRHVDLTCEACGYQYRAGASVENPEEGGREEIYAATCPLCRHYHVLDKKGNPNEQSFSGDRILVSKFAYELGEPRRWDVIVFKYPGNAKQNFIKRLVGLPGETLWIYQGDVFVVQGEYDGTTPLQDNPPGEIARKPDRKLLAMLQLVDDTRYRAEAMLKAGYPLRWQAWSTLRGQPASEWATADLGDSYTADTRQASQPVFLRYWHYLPNYQEWDDVNKIEALRTRGDQAGAERLLSELRQAWKELPPDPSPITDYYAYNDFDTRTTGESSAYLDVHSKGSPGLHWVGDLAVEANVRLEAASPDGQLVLELVEGGTRYRCAIAVSDGTATLEMVGGSGQFLGPDGQQTASPQAQTPVRGAGQYQLRLSNVDDELRLWVNGRRIQFDGPTTYTPPDRSQVRPRFSESDPGDLSPAAIGARGLQLKVERLRIYRDVYYISTAQNQSSDYDLSGWQSSHSLRGADDLLSNLFDFRTWENSGFFEKRRPRRFALHPDAFFPLGDNSPQSKDARLWASRPHDLVFIPPYVERDLMIGKALLIYWPHTWRRPIPLLPNFARMGRIR